MSAVRTLVAAITASIWSIAPRNRAGRFKSEMTGTHTDLYHPAHSNQGYHGEEGKTFGVWALLPMLP